MNHIVFWIGFALLGFSCSGGKSGPEFVKFIRSEESGMKGEVTQPDYKLMIQYLPPEYFILRELSIVQGSNLDSLKEKYGDQFTFELKLMATKGGQDILTYQATNDQEQFLRVKYLSSDVKNSLMLIQGTDTFPCLIHHYERSYHLTPYALILATFSKPKPTTDFDLVWVDTCFSQGIFHYTFDSKKLLTPPSINWNNL